MNNMERLDNYESNVLGSGTGNQSEPEWYLEYECGDCNHYNKEFEDCGALLKDVRPTDIACECYDEPGLITPRQFKALKRRA